MAVVPVGSGGARLGTGGSTALNLSSDQIREVQTVLKERGFNVVVDGKMGSRTMEAITAFQRQQGFQVSGRIDNQTISALGLSNKIGAQGTGEGASAGQSGANQQQAPAQQNQGANQPSSGQSSGQQQAPAQQGGAKQQEPAQQNQDVNQPSTSGQSSSQQQAPAQQNQASGQNSGNK